MQTTINSGSVGVAPGLSITGNYQLLAGEEERNTSDAIQCTSDLQSAHGVTQNAICTQNLASSDLAGKNEYIYSLSCLLY